jgi:hypothetical protein
MRSHLALGGVGPPLARLQLLLAVDVVRVEHAIALLRALAPYEQLHLALAVVDEGVTDACACRKGGKVTWPHPVEVPVHPGIHLTQEDVDELLFVTLSVGPGSTVSRWNPLQVDPKPLETGGATEAASV